MAMFEWFSGPYAGFLTGVLFLLKNPAACTAVDLLRSFSTLLLAIITFRLCAQAVAHRALLRRSIAYTPDDTPALFRLYDEAAASVGLASAPRLYQAPSGGPAAFTTGLLRPAIFVAPSVLTTLTADECRAVLTHELVHVRRRDNLRGWAAAVSAAVLLTLLFQAVSLYIAFFHSSVRFSHLHAVAIISAAISGVHLLQRYGRAPVLLYRETSCDDRVVRLLGDPLVVAAALIKVWRIQRGFDVRQIGSLSTLAFIEQATFERRIRRLVEYEAVSGREWINRGVWMLGLLAALWLLSFLWTFHFGGLGAVALNVVGSV